MSNEPPAIVTQPRAGRRRRGWWLILKYSLPLVVSLATGELALRAYVWSRGWTANCYATQLFLFRPRDDVGCDLRPGFRLRSGHFEITINSLGMRGPEIDREKPPSVQRVAIVGESSTFGYLVRDEEVAARKLERNLRERGLNVEVLNAGVPGYNLNQSTVRFREVVAPLKPDLVLAYLGWNDLTYVVSDEPSARRFHVRPDYFAIPAWERLMGHSTLCGLVIYRLWKRPMQMTPAQIGGTRPTEAGTAAFRANLARLADDAAAAGAPLVLCAQATAAHPDVPAELEPWLAKTPEKRMEMIELGSWLHDTEADFAAERHLPFLDARKAIEPTTENLGDFVHLTPEGERKLAEFWADELAPMLEE
jgi:lysophospholipase L1-like esterase